MPDGGVEGFEIFGLMPVFPVLPYFPESVAFQQGFKQAVFASELESLGYLGEHVAVVYLTHVHPCRLPEVELQHLENLRIREPGSCPGGEKLALGDDVDAGVSGLMVKSLALLVVMFVIIFLIYCSEFIVVGLI